VGLRLAERERKERPRRVPLRLAQRRRRGHRHSTVGDPIAGAGGRAAGCSRFRRRRGARG
jgi:hypothetical protein